MQKDFIRLYFLWAPILHNSSKVLKSKFHKKKKNSQSVNLLSNIRVSLS